jgi:hypothetical protein
VYRLGRVQVERRGAGARQRRRDLVADVSGLAHAGDDYPSLAGEYQLTVPRKIPIEPVLEGSHGPGLRRQDASAAVDQQFSACIDRSHRRIPVQDDVIIPPVTQARARALAQREQPEVG